MNLGNERDPNVGLQEQGATFMIPQVPIGDRARGSSRGPRPTQAARREGTERPLHARPLVHTRPVVGLVVVRPRLQVRN
jgi:hypothetical protein